MNHTQGKLLALKLAGHTWLLEGVKPTELARLKKNLVPIPEEPCPNTVSWRFRKKGNGRFLAPSREFEMDFDYHDDEVFLRGTMFNAHIRLRPHITATVELADTKGVFTKSITENMMRTLVAYQALEDGGILLHSACFGDDDRAWVVFGHSGAGKSTCSNFAREAGYGVMSDDMNLLLPAASGWQVRRVPFCGTAQGNVHHKSALPLRSVNLLRQSDDLRLEGMSPATATAALVASAAFVNEDPWREAQLLDNCARLAREIPVNTLYFRRDPGFIPLVTQGHRDRNDT